MVSFHETKQAFSFTKYVNNGKIIKKNVLSMNIQKCISKFSGWYG